MERNPAYIDAIAFLEADHALLSGRMEQLFKMPSAPSLDALRRVCASIKIHLALEAEIFYPRYLSTTHDTLAAFVATVNRESVADLIKEIEHEQLSAHELHDRVTELARLVAHHVHEAERPGGPFVTARHCGVDPAGMGSALIARREELMAKSKSHVI